MKSYNPGMNPINTDELRKAWPIPGRMVTHSEECAKWHYTCAINRLCDELDKERKKSATYYNLARHYFVTSSYDDDDDGC